MFLCINIIMLRTVITMTNFVFYVHQCSAYISVCLRVTELLKQELQIVVVCHVAAGN